MEAVQPYALNPVRLTTLLAALYAETDDEANIGLYKEPLFPTGNTVLGDIVPADFDGYAPIELEMGDVNQDSQYNAYAISQALQWSPSGTTTPNGIYGVYVFKDGVLIAVQAFDTPRTMEGPLNSVAGLWRAQDPFGGGWIDAG